MSDAAVPRLRVQGDPMPQSRRYRRLWRVLQALPPTQAQAQLSLAELTTLLGPSTTPGGIPSWTPQALAAALDGRYGFRIRFDPQQQALICTRLHGREETLDA